MDKGGNACGERFSPSSARSLRSGPDITSADPPLAFGPAVPGQSMSSVMAALPEADWRAYRNGAGALKGALASSAITFIDWRWTLRLGEAPADPDVPVGGYNFTLGADRRFERAGQCVGLMSTAVAALEAELGGVFMPGDWSEAGPPGPYLAPPGRAATEISVGGNSRLGMFPTPGQDIYIGGRDLALGAATRVRIRGIEVPDRIGGRLGYLCFISIAFRGPPPAS